MPPQMNGSTASLLVVGLFSVLAGISQCGDPSLPPAAEDWSRDILTTQLEIDISALFGSAFIEIAASSSTTGLSLEASGLNILGIYLEDGTELNWSRDTSDGSVDIGVPEGLSLVRIDYEFQTHPYTFDGYMVGGDTFIWPDFCSNLFPCHSDPADGLKFSVSLSGLEAGQSVVAPEQLIELDAPAYQLGFTVGEYTRHDLGRTTLGTSVAFFSLPTDAPDDITSGTQNFVAYVDMLEKWFGKYPYGPEVGAKSVLWCATGNCEYAGMEEHPYFDVSDGSVYDPTVYAHETAHAWFGDGVRLECWGEDLVLSEGTASYLEIAILGLVEGEDAADAVVEYYQEWLAQSHASGEDAIVWPESCDEVDTYDIWYSVTYSRGALFWYDVEQEVGRAALLGAFADFLDIYLGDTATMGQLLDTVYVSTGFDPYPLAEQWLRSTEFPI